MLQQNILPVLRMLDSEGIPMLMLSRAALTLETYADSSMCLIDAFDVFMTPSDSTKASTLILQTGEWSLNHISPRHKRQRRNTNGKITFYNKQGHRLNLWSRLNLQYATSPSEPHYWTHAKPIKIHDVKIYTLCPTDQVLALCFDGLYINRVLAVDWIAHIANILYLHPEGLD